MDNIEYGTHEAYMRRAIELAALGDGHTDPNPLVGAVIVKDGRIIGEGYHEVYGSLHAERNALKACTEDPKGADMYVTLEPCCHYGKQPPCTLALIEAGIKHVYVGSADPNPKVAGKGIVQLRKAGIEVTENFMREECDALNPVFFHYISTMEPYIALKYAMTADGRIATDAGKSQWITGVKAREHVHKLRSRYKGILVGIGTVLADDPMLTCRMEGGRNPVRIVLDTHLRIPIGSKIVQSAKDVPTIVICSKDVVGYGQSADCSVTEESSSSSAGTDRDMTDFEANNNDICGCYDESVSSVSDSRAEQTLRIEDKLIQLRSLGVEVLGVSEENGHVSITEALKLLGEKGINGILVEGGAHINGAFIEAGKVNRIYSYIGAKVFGGSVLKNPVIGLGFKTPDTALKLSNPKVSVFDDDVLIQYDVKEKHTCSQE